MNDLIETAIDGVLTEQDALTYVIENGASEQLLQDLGFSNAIKSSIKTAGKLDNIFNKCKGNTKLLIGVIALLITTGQLFGYEVKENDNLWSIAKRNKCRLSQIYKLNPGLKQKEYIYPGMNIVLPNEIKNMKIETQQQQYTHKNEKLNLDAALKALREVESSNGINTKGDKGKAIGDYQLWEIFVEDYHRLGGKKEYKCHVVDGVAQPDDVRWDKAKSQEIIKHVFKKYGYKNMREVLKGFGTGKRKRPGWNKGVSQSKLQEYIDAYNKYNK